MGGYQKQGDLVVAELPMLSVDGAEELGPAPSQGLFGVGVVVNELRHGIEGPLLKVEVTSPRQLHQEMQGSPFPLDRHDCFLLLLKNTLREVSMFPLSQSHRRE